MEQKKETLIKLMNREITPNECLSKFPTRNDRELEKLILTSDIPLVVRRGLSLKDIQSMNFVEVREYCKNKIKKGINLSDLALELDIKWENGEISGFDYRYFKESVGLIIAKELISRAKSIGRYEK